MKKPKVYLPWGNIKVYSLRKPTSVQIICGDCSSRVDEAGNTELLPLRTLLAKDGRCYTCGSSSFVFAAELCRVLRHTIAERRTQPTAELTLPITRNTDPPLWRESNSSADSPSRNATAPSKTFTDASSCIN